MSSFTLTPETMRAHRARWYVYVDGTRMPRVTTMRGHWDYDVVCSCGWDSGTGGGLRRYVEDKLWQHRWDAQYEAEQEPVEVSPWVRWQENSHT